LTSWYNKSSYRIAAGVALLICGTFIGMLLDGGLRNLYSSNELKQLHSEVSDLKKSTMFTMLKQESSSDRIQAVNYAGDLDNADEKVIEALIKTLNTDKNVNVRMAAAYALSKFADQRLVSDSLVKSLSLQNDPILQVTLINILAERREKSALRPIQEIIANKSTLKEVRAVAENSLRVLI
jgi:HEAT repeat protein